MLEILDYIWDHLMKRMEKHVKLMKKVKDKICLRIRKKLECIRKQTEHWVVKPIMSYEFEVSMLNEQFTVDLLHIHVVVDGWI